LDKNTRQSIANPTITLRRLDTGVWVSPGQDSDVPILVPPSIPTQLTVEAKGYVTWSNYDSNKANADALLNRLLKNSMSTVEGGRIGDGKPSSASYGSFLGHPDAIDFSRFRKDRVFQQPVKVKSGDEIQLTVELEGAH
jgi:hypothetical protein